MGVFDKLPGLGGGGEADGAESSGDPSGSDGEPEGHTDLTPADLRDRAERLAGRSDVPTLDFTVPSLDRLDDLASGRPSPVDDEIDYGSYLGETLVREFGGEWTDDDGWQVAVPLPDDETTVAVFDAARMSIDDHPVFASVGNRLAAEGAERTPDDGGSDDGEADAGAGGPGAGDEMDAPDADVEPTDADDAAVATDVEPAATDVGDAPDDPPTEPDDVDVSTADTPLVADPDEGTTAESVDEPTAGPAETDADGGDAVEATGSTSSTGEDATEGDELPAEPSEDADVGEHSTDEDGEPTNEDDMSADENEVSTDRFGVSTDRIEPDDPGPSETTDESPGNAGDVPDSPDDAGPVGPSVDAGDAATAAGTDESVDAAADVDADETAPAGAPTDDSGGPDDDPGDQPDDENVPISEQIESIARQYGESADDGNADARSDDATDAPDGTDAETRTGSAGTGDADGGAADPGPTSVDDGDDRTDGEDAGDDAIDPTADAVDQTEEVLDPTGDAPDPTESGPTATDPPETDTTVAETTPPGLSPDATAGRAVQDGNPPDDPQSGNEESQSGNDGPGAPDRYELREAAERLVEDWPENDLDFTPPSLPRLDAFVDDQWDGRFDAAALAERTVDHGDDGDPLAQLGAYYAEVSIRWLDGEWVAGEGTDGEGAVAVPGVGEKTETVAVFDAARECLTAGSTFAYRFDALVNRLHADESTVSGGRADVFDADRETLTSGEVITQFAAAADEFADAWPGYDLDYSPRSLQYLDELVDGRLTTDDFDDAALGDGADPAALRLTERATATGAYFAAVLLRHRDAQWRIGDDVELLIDRPDGTTTVDPVATAADCLRGEGSFTGTFAAVGD